jgi:hypothetical protein
MDHDNVSLDTRPRVEHRDDKFFNGMLLAYIVSILVTSFYCLFAL